MNSLGKLAAALTLAGAVATLGAGVTSAQLANWDQQRVTDIAKEFSQEATTARQVARKALGSSQIGTGQAHAQYRFLDQLRLIQSEAGHLARELEKGKDRDKTMSVYRRLMSLIAEAQENARKMFMPDDLLNQLGTAGDALRRLRPYYSAEANANPDAGETTE